MATRVEKRTLRDRVDALRTNVYRLYRTTNFGEAALTKKSSITRFKTYLKQTKQLATLVYKLKPDDRAWQYYDESMVKVDDDLHYQKTGYGIRAYAVGRLHQALDNLLGAVSRVKAREIDLVPELAHKAKYGGPQTRAEARAVLADLLEEKGYEGEANTLRSTDKWPVIKKVLISMGIEVPGYEPYYKVDRDARKIQMRSGDGWLARRLSARKKRRR